MLCSNQNKGMMERGNHQCTEFLWLEDDAVIASAVQRHLESWGYQVACAVRFDDVLSDFAAFDPQLVLLDISLPFFNGYHWCREIRKVSKVPILFLTSASDDMNLVMAMEMGGDDLAGQALSPAGALRQGAGHARRAYDFAGTAHLALLRRRGAERCPTGP